MITLPASFSSDILSGAGDFLTTMSPFIITIGGVLLGMLAVGFIISLLKH